MIMVIVTGRGNMVWKYLKCLESIAVKEKEKKERFHPILQWLLKSLICRHGDNGNGMYGFQTGGLNGNPLRQSGALKL